MSERSSVRNLIYFKLSYLKCNQSNVFKVYIHLLSNRIFWELFVHNHCFSSSDDHYQRRTLAGLRGRRSKGKGKKGKGIRARDRARGKSEEVPFLSPSRAQISASPFNTCHAGYTLASIYNFNNHLSSKEISSHRKEVKEGRGHGG